MVLEWFVFLNGDAVVSLGGGRTLLDQGRSWILRVEPWPVSISRALKPYSPWKYTSRSHNVYL